MRIASRLSFTLLFLVHTIASQEGSVSPKIKQFLAAKCKEYTKTLNQDFEILPLVAGGNPEIVSIPICEQGGEQLIVGGQPARDGEFPHMAAVGFRNPSGGYLWLCGGTLISERYVLSAAHCVFSRSNGRAEKIRLGTINVNEEAQPHLQEYNIADIIRHSEYKRTKKYHDIALFKLDADVRFTKDVRPACLFTEDTNNNANVIATGWGKQSTFGPTSNILLKVGLHIYNNEECAHTYRRDLANGVTRELVCAGYQPGGRDTCLGDSGGPLVISKEHYQCIYYVVGVTSFGKICGERNILGIYTRVSAYTDWIVNNTWGQI